MDALEARAITNDNLKRPDIDGYVAVLDEAIREASKNGEFAINMMENMVYQDPRPRNLRTLFVGIEHDAIINYYEERGFVVRDHLPSTIISW